MNNGWKRQHPAAIFIGFLNNLKEMIITVIAVFIFGQSSQAGGSLFYIIFFTIILVVSLGSGVIKWATFRYLVAENELTIKQGLIFRKNRFIRRERVQSIDLNEKILQRLFNLVEVRIETAGGGAEPEFKIVAVKKAEALTIKHLLLHQNQEGPVTSDQVIEEVMENDLGEEQSTAENGHVDYQQPSFTWEITNQRLLIAAVTSSGIGIAATFVAAITSQVQQFIPDVYFERAVGLVLHSSFLLIGAWLFFILIISWLITLINTLLKYGMFRIEKEKDDIHISRGVLEKRQLTISAKRITSVRIVQNLLRQPFGLVAVYVESAGGGRKEEDLSTILIPICKQEEVNGILKYLLPEYEIEREYHPLPRESVRRYMIRLIVPTLIAAGIFTYFFSYGWISLLLPIFAACYGYWQFIDAGIGKNEGMLWLKSRTLARTEVIVPRKRIQAMTTTQSLFQRFDNLYTLQVSIITSIIGKTFTLRHISSDQSEECYDWYSYEEKKKAPIE